MRKEFLNIYFQIEWTYDFLSDDSDDFSFGLFFILRMVFSISDSQILFTKGQFPCLYYMPACLSRLPAGMYLSSLPSLASCTEILHFVQNDGPGRKAPQRVASFPSPMTPMQHRPPVISSGGQRKNDEIVSRSEWNGVEKSPSPMLPAGFASPAFLPTGIYHHCRH